MTLRPSDMLQIQSAIDEYERKFPRRPPPTAEEALAWRLGKREWARRQAADRAEQEGSPEPAFGGKEKPQEIVAKQECNAAAWLWQQFRLRLHIWSLSFDSWEGFEGTMPWVKGALRVGLWGLVAVVVVSVFLFGAIVGGLK